MKYNTDMIEYSVQTTNAALFNNSKEFDSLVLFFFFFVY